MTPITLLKSSFSSQGGLEKATTFLARSFIERGHPVTLLTAGTPPTLDGVEVIRCPDWPKMSLNKLRVFDQFCRDFLKENPTPIVFGMDRNSYQTHLRAGNGVHREYLKSRKDSESNWMHWRHMVNPLHLQLLALEKAAFENPQLERIFTNSYMVKNDILYNYNVDPKKIKVIHNGVEWKALEVPFSEWESVRSALLKKYGLDEDCYQLLFVGHNFKRKGLSKILRALARLPNKKVQLSVVGKDKNLETFSQLAAELGLTKQVFFFGPQSSALPFYQLADSLVIPSQYDPFANVTVEAAAMGVFVISARSNGGCEVLTPGSGTLIEKLSEDDSVVAAIEWALNHPKTAESSEHIRGTVQHLEMENQMEKYISETLASCASPTT
ncbi:MAG: D-inositol 3-phosphate glycosyltransferase [Chlamydiae bacterium]|nr:D-inositol 3-phosphate glycosyltransferase [Chlamydiota bacterium]